MKKIYLVWGITGKEEYEDREEWVVCAFAYKSKAIDYAKKCEDEGKRILERYYKEQGSKWLHRWDHENMEQYANRYDEEMCIKGDIEYFFTEVFFDNCSMDVSL